MQTLPFLHFWTSDMNGVFTLRVFSSLPLPLPHLGGTIRLPPFCPHAHTYLHRCGQICLQEIKK